MKKIIITEEDKIDILQKHYGESNSELFKYLLETFKVNRAFYFNDLNFHPILFKGHIKIDIDGDKRNTDLIYTHNKKDLKYNIVRFIMDDPKLYETLSIKIIDKISEQIKSTDDEEEKNMYRQELKNQIEILLDNPTTRRSIETKIHTVVKDFINYSISEALKTK